MSLLEQLLSRKPAAPPAPKPVKEPEALCAVCGTVTTRKCGPCARSGVGIYFCSQNHQDLVAKAHKPVCGSKLAPLPTPYLTKDEAELWRKFKGVRMSPGMPTSAEMQERKNMTLKAGDFEKVLLPILQGVGNGLYHDKPNNTMVGFWMTEADRAIVLQSYRSDFFAVKRTFYDHAEFMESSGSAFDFAAYVYQFLHRFHENDNIPVEVKNLYHHRAVILGELCHLMVVKPKDNPPKEPTVMQIKAAVTLLYRSILAYLPVPDDFVGRAPAKPMEDLHGVVHLVKNEVYMIIGLYKEMWDLNARNRHEVRNITVV